METYLPLYAGLGHEVDKLPSQSAAEDYSVRLSELLNSDVPSLVDPGSQWKHISRSMRYLVAKSGCRQVAITIRS